MRPTARTNASPCPSLQHVGLADGLVCLGREKAHRTNRHHHGIRHYSFKIISVFGVQCSIFGVLLLLLLLPSIGFSQRTINVLQGAEIVQAAELRIRDEFSETRVSNELIESVIRVSLRYENTGNVYHDVYTSWSVVFDIDLTPISGTGTTTFTNQTLTIDYQPGGGVYTSEEVLDFSGFRSGTITVVPLPAQGTYAMPQGMIFSIELIQKTRFNLNITHAPKVKMLKNSPQVASKNVLPVWWNYRHGDESYDLEWLFVDVPTDNIVNVDLSKISYDFRNATRINLHANHYEIPLAYPSGVLLVRVRANGWVKHGTGASAGYFFQEGPWSWATTISTQIDYHMPAEMYYLFQGLERDENWQYMATFAEQGKRKEVITFFDGSLRSRQQVTVLNSNNMAVVGETMYDHMGRGSLQVLPTPVPSQGIRYYAHTTGTVFNQGYTRADFDKDNTINDPAPFPAGVGPAGYYSSQNTFLNNHFLEAMGSIPAVDDALTGGYPFTQTRFMNDGSGRIHSQSGVGGTHMLGSGHETRYYYGKPAGQRELDALFANEIGDVAFYRKDMVMDPNKLVSVSLLDPQGRVRATAISHNTHTNKDSVDYVTDTAFTSTEQLLSKQTPNPNMELVSSSVLSVSAGGTYFFEYLLDTLYYRDTCDGMDPVLCIYDLEISIYDNQEEVFLYNNLITHIGNTPGTLEFDLTLDIGNYIVTKVLKPNQDSLQAYLQQYAETQDCVPVPQVPWDSCNYECGADCYYLVMDSVWTGTEWEYITLAGDTLTASQAASAIAACVHSACDTATISYFDECAWRRSLLVRDMSPGGQYFDNHPAMFTPDLNPVPGHIPNGWLMSKVVVLNEDSVRTMFDLNMPPFPGVDEAWTYVRQNWQESYIDALLPYHPEYCTWFFYCENTGRCDTICQIPPVAPHIMAESNAFDAAFNAISPDHFVDYYQNPLGLPTSSDVFSYQPWPTVISDPLFVWDCGDCGLLLDNFSPPVNLKDYTPRIQDSLLDFVPLKDINGVITDHLSIWYLLDDPHDIASSCTTNIQALDDYLGNGYNQHVLDAFDMFHNTIMNPDSLNLNKYDIFRSIYMFYKRQILQGIFELEINNVPQYTFSRKNCPCGTPSSYYIADLGSSLPQGVLKSPSGFYAYYFHDPVLSGNSYTNIVAEVSETVCRTHCEAFADDWMEALDPLINNGCIHIGDLSDIREMLVQVCVKGCDQDNPYGSDTILGATGVVNPWLTPTKTHFSFNQVLDVYKTTNCTSVSLNGTITHPPVQVSDAECSCNRLGELLKDLGLNWSSDNGTIAVQLEAIWGINYPHTTIGNWKTRCNPPATDLTIANLLNNDFPESLLCQFPPDSVLNGGNDSIQVLIDSCNAKAEAEALLAGDMTYNRLLSLAMKRFSTAYLNTSVNEARESFTCTYTRKEYHYTLYYYDQAGNLIKTVPPAGVNRLTETAVDNCQDYRADTSLGFVHAAHALVTNYKYNSLNQVREQSTPDGGVTRFWYDALGRLIVSQNAKQAVQTPDPAYSYTIYDPLGRIIEVGQLMASGDPDDFMKFDDYEDWLSATTNHEQITHTVYDVATIDNIPGQANDSQENLRNRISCVLYQQTRVQLSGGTFFDPDLSEYDYASYYSYDVHGNVKTVVHDDQLFRIMYGAVEITKKIDYLYDLVSGSVKEVIYQQTKADEFRHRYHYDADNRITHVYTSRNGMIWQRDAKYFYYPHGPLARVEVGQEQVQAFDYAYTLHGWLKGVNTNTLVAGTDIGSDGRGDETNPNRWFGQDAAGFSLGYYDGDYQAIGQNGGDFLNANLQAVYTPADNDLFNGNISHMVTAIHEAMTPSGFTPVPQATTYRYDRLNRIKQMKAYQGTVTNDVWTAQTTETYSSAYKYDFNGNITELERYAGVDKIDDLEYYYDHEDHHTKTGMVSNRLYLVDEQSTHPGGKDLKPGTKTAAGFDRNDPTSWNYQYDPIGNLIKDVNEGIDLISWTVTGKVSEVVFDPAKQNYNLAFRYDPMGNRIAKIQKPHATLANCTTWTITWYSRDAQGNVLAVYNKPTDSLNFRATEFNIYGSSRIGMVTQPEELTQKQNDTLRHTMVLGLKVYEFSNHLGNVLTTFSDRKIATEATPGYVAYYSAEILSSTDYYPFGFEMPGRSYTGGGYRYGFNGQEKVDEIAGNGNSYTAEFWQYDPRVSRRWNVDPVVKFFMSDYAAFSNNPIIMVDPNGDADYYNKRGKWIGTDGIDDGRIIVATQKSTIRSIKNATRQGMNITINHEIYSDLVELPAFSQRISIAVSLREANDSGREYGGHSNSVGETVHWDPGTKPQEIKMVDKEGNIQYGAAASLNPFMKNGEKVEPRLSDLSVIWHIHPNVTIQHRDAETGNVVSTSRLGSSTPSNSVFGDNTRGDLAKAAEWESKGFKGNNIVVGGRDRNVTYYNSSGVTATIDFDNFMWIGSENPGNRGRLYRRFLNHRANAECPSSNAQPQYSNPLRSLETQAY